MTTPSAVDEALDRTAVGQVVELTMENLGQALRDTAILAAEVRRLRQPVSDAEVSALEGRLEDANSVSSNHMAWNIARDAIDLLRRRTAGADTLALLREAREILNLISTAQPFPHAESERLRLLAQRIDYATAPPAAGAAP